MRPTWLLACSVWSCESVDPSCEVGLSADGLESLCEDIPQKDDAIDCPPELELEDIKDVYSWCWTFDDGWSGCGVAIDSVAAIHGMVVDVSCGADYDLAGYPDRDQPDPALEDPAVLGYSSLKIKRDGDTCKVDRACCEHTALWR